MKVMYDSIDVGQLPADAYAVAGYVAGHWPDWSLECQRFPALAKAGRILSIAVTAAEDAECLDIENGDAIPAQAGPWAVRQIKLGVKRPVLYSDRSDHPAVVTSVRAAGLTRVQVRYWIATLDGVEALYGDSDATQWTDKALGRNLDQSVLRDDFFDDPAPVVVNLPHYDWFDERPRLVFAGKTEREVVQAYDKYRAEQTPTKHPNRAQLYVLRVMLRTAASRVWKVAHQQKAPTGKPSWGVDHRGWRYQNLIKRSAGQRLV